MSHGFRKLAILTGAGMAAGYSDPSPYTVSENVGGSKEI